MTGPEGPIITPGFETEPGLIPVPATVAGEEEAGNPEEADALQTQSPKRSVLFLAGSLATGNTIAMVLRMAGGLLMGRIVAPATLGLFNGIGLVLGYVPFLHLGILSGLNRELPYFIGKGDRKRAEELAAAAQAWALSLGAMVFVALAGIAVWQLTQGEMWKAAGWLTNGVSSMYLFFSTYYLQVTYRTSHDFARLAVINVIDASAALVLLGAVVLLNFYGLCVRSVLISLVTTSFLFKWGPLRVRPHWNFKHLKHLLFIGAPIFGVGQIFAWWTVLNSTLVLKLSGTTGMGLYAMVLLATAALDVVPTSVSQVLYPRMAEEYGRSGAVRNLLRILRKPVLFTIAGLVPVVAAAWFLVEPVMRLVVPKYIDAAPAARWALFLVFISGLMPVTSVFNTVRRQDLYAVATITGMACYVGTLLYLVRDEVNLTSFPQAMLVGRAVFIILCYLFVWRLRNKSLRTQNPDSSVVPDA
jgi:O-antigen/teichoic acid export membrane protein